MGSFTSHVTKWQKPKALSQTEHQTLLRGLAGTIQNNRDGAIVNAHIRGMIPAGTETRTVHRAYNHASMLALHDYGVLDYDFKMDDQLKSDMKPLEPFIRYSRRRVIDQMRVAHKGKWQPYRKEFGTPFTDNRKDKVTGETRLRTKSNLILVKSFEEDKHKRSDLGEFSREGDKEKSDLVQPAQIIGGAIGASVAAGAAGAVAARPVAHIAQVVGRRAAAGIRLSASKAGVMSNPFSSSIIRGQAKLGGYMAHAGVKGLLAASIGVAAGLAGDYLGDKGARVVTGKTGAEDEYRHASIIGMATGMAGMAMGHKVIASRLWRPLRYSGVRRGLAGVTAAVIGSIAAEGAGNLVDEHIRATDMLAGVNRRTTERFSHGSGMNKRDLSQAQLEQRRAAARARWQKSGSSSASLRRGLVASYPEVGSAITPKSAINMMRQWGRTNRTERAIFTNSEMTRVIGRSIGTRMSVDGGRHEESFVAAKSPITTLHNHPYPSPLSVPDAATLIAKPLAVAQAEGRATAKQIEEFREGTPDFGRIMAADPNGAISSLSLKVSPEEAMRPIVRVQTLHQIMHQRAGMRRFGRDMRVSPLAISNEEGLRLAPMAHGHWKELDRQGVVNYQSTGTYSEAGRRAGEKLVRMSNRLSADQVARLSMKNSADHTTLAMIAAAFRKMKLFKYA